MNQGVIYEDYDEFTSLGEGTIALQVYWYSANELTGYHKS